MGSMVRLIPLVPIAAAAILAQDPNRISYINESLRNLLSEAYSVRLFQVFGPASIDTERFDIVATLAPNSTREQSRAMLQKLITERFHAVIHHEQREFSVFDLTVAKSGAKLTPAAAAGNPGAAMSTNNSQARLTVTKGTTADLIRSLETEAGTAIIVFDFTVEFGHLKLDRAKGPAPCDCCRSG